MGKIGDLEETLLHIWAKMIAQFVSDDGPWNVTLQFQALLLGYFGHVPETIWCCPLGDRLCLLVPTAGIFFSGITVPDLENYGCLF